MELRQRPWGLDVGGTMVARWSKTVVCLCLTLGKFMLAERLGTDEKNFVCCTHMHSLVCLTLSLFEVKHWERLCARLLDKFGRTSILCWITIPVTCRTCNSRCDKGGDAQIHTMVSEFTRFWRFIDVSHIHQTSLTHAPQTCS